MTRTSGSKKWKELRGHRPNPNEGTIPPTSLRAALTGKTRAGVLDVEALAAAALGDGPSAVPHTHVP